MILEHKNIFGITCWCPIYHHAEQNILPNKFQRYEIFYWIKYSRRIFYWTQMFTERLLFKDGLFLWYEICYWKGTLLKWKNTIYVPPWLTIYTNLRTCSTLGYITVFLVLFPVPLFHVTPRSAHNLNPIAFWDTTEVACRFQRPVSKIVGLLIYFVGWWSPR